jgi:hypothetical protein
MMENRENEEVVEIEQTERPQRNATRLDNELKRLGMDKPTRIEDGEIGICTRSKTDQVAFNATLSRIPETFQKAMDRRNRHNWVPSAKEEINNFLSREARKKYPDRH